MSKVQAMRVDVRCAALVALLCLGAAAADTAAADAVKCSFVHEEIMVALSDPPSGRAKEYNDFFEKVHIPEVLSRGIGFEGAQRFHVLASVGSTPWNYLSVYGLERGNRIAETGVKFKPGAVPATKPGPYLAEGSAAWILRRTAAGTGDDAGHHVECPRGQKVFVVLPGAQSPQLDLNKMLSSIPGLASAERYEFKVATKGAPPAASKIAILRAREHADVSATLQRLGALVGCKAAQCTGSSGAVWALEPQADYVAGAEVSDK
jgi:hypothetical protein